MKFTSFLMDKLFAIVLYLVFYSIVYLLLIAFKVDTSLIIAITILFVLFGLITLCWEYFRKNKFYKTLINNVNLLDKSYLVLETLEKPRFYEGILFTEIMYKINKSMLENVKKYELMTKDFKEYIELWIHEVKIPIQALELMLHNKKNSKELREVKRLEGFIEQVLYYERGENASEDYLIKEVNLKDVIKNVALRNKDILLEEKIDLIVDDTEALVLSDAKWLEFIINQIISNSIKYKSENNSYIHISIKDDKNNTTLIIEDNGIGINASDLPRVFNKTFTGSNGHNSTSSTGMGLYIVKNLCNKLGHDIDIASTKGKYTKVLITFYKEKDLKMLQNCNVLID